MNTEPLDWIYGRRSIRSYTRQKISDEMITELLKAAMAAPSAVAKDPWRFIVVTEKNLLKKICEGLPNGKFLEDAPLGIIVCGDLEATHTNELSYLLQDCSAAIENLLLAAHILKLGACWLGIHPRTERINHIKTLFNLPENIIPVACLAIGYPAEKKEKRTRFNSIYVHYNQWR